jgi:hypothetical protein
MMFTAAQKHLIAETDLDLRKLERQAAIGDPEAEERLQRMKQRECDHSNTEVKHGFGGGYEDSYEWWELDCSDCGLNLESHSAPGWENPHPPEWAEPEGFHGYENWDSYWKGSLGGFDDSEPPSGLDPIEVSID